MISRDIEEIIDSLSMQFYGRFLSSLEYILDGLDFMPEDVLSDDNSVQFEYSNRKGDCLQFTIYEDLHVESYFTSRHDEQDCIIDSEYHEVIDFINDKVRGLYARR